jgi:hypothetical protein
LEVFNIQSTPLSGAHSRSFGKSDLNRSRLLGMIRNRSSQLANLEICRECLKQNNNNPQRAYNSLKQAFCMAGAGSPSETLRSMLFREATNRDIKEVTAFGPTKMTYAVSFTRFLPTTSSGAIDLSKMEKFGGGGTQDIYRVRHGNQDYVVKVHRQSIGQDPQARLEKYQELRQSYETLHRHFGANHCTLEQLLLRDIYSGDQTEQAMISIAEFEPGYLANSKVGLNAGHFEWDTLPMILQPKLFESMYHGLLGEDVSQFNLYAVVSTNTRLAEYKKLIETDSGFKDSLREFLGQFKSYFQETGQYLDINGIDNIIFFKDTNSRGWTFRLGTVIKRETREKLSDALDVLEGNPSEFKDSKELRPQVNMARQWTLALNTLGIWIGLGKVIDDSNTRKMDTMLDKMHDMGFTHKPKMPEEERLKCVKLVSDISRCSSSELSGLLASFEPSIQENPGLYVDILDTVELDKKLILAQAIHDSLPTASPESMGATTQYCELRYGIAMKLMEFSEENSTAKQITLACLRDVLHDRTAPESRIQKFISNLGG